MMVSANFECNLGAQLVEPAVVALPRYCLDAAIHKRFEQSHALQIGEINAALMAAWNACVHGMCALQFPSLGKSIEEFALYNALLAGFASRAAQGCLVNVAEVPVPDEQIIIQVGKGQPIR